MSAAVVVLAAVAIGCVPAASALAHARWPRRSPVAAILLWQAIGLGWALGTVGALLGLGAAADRSGVAAGAVVRMADVARELLLPGKVGISARPAAAGPALTVLGAAQLACLAAGLALLAVLCWILVAALAAAFRARRRQHALLSLLARGDPKVPGALVVDHPAAAAYCLPGLHSAIVVSAGVLTLLDDDELAAVLAHERAHLRERHDLVLLPFAALLRAFRWAAVARQAQRAVVLLVEMHADDRARRHRPARELATALMRVSAAGRSVVPVGALAAADSAAGYDVTARVIRLLRPSPALGAAARAAVGLAVLAAVVVPVAVLALPLR